MMAGTEHKRASSVAVNPKVILVLVILATALSNLEVGLVNVALPTLADRFDVAPTTIQWVAIAYQLAIIGTLVPFGRLVDMYGGRVIYLTGMTTVATASILLAASLNVIWMILSRGLLGIGAAMLLATSQALILKAFPEEGRGRAFGIMHMAVASGLMAGPSSGGFILSATGWRFLFALPIAVATIALVLGWPSLPRHTSSTDNEPLDLSGATFIFLTITSGVLALTGFSQQGVSTTNILLLLMAIVLGLLFVVIERRQAVPLVELSILGNWKLASGLVAAFLTFIALASNMFLIPFALQDLLGLSVASAGLAMITVPLVILPVAPLAGILADHLGSRLPTVAGSSVIVVSIIGMALFDSATPTSIAVLTLAVYGLGAGLFQAPNNSAVLSAAPETQQGLTSGMLALSRNLGQVVGITLASAIWTWRQAVYASETTGDTATALGPALQDTFLVLAGFGLLAVIISLSRP